MECLYPKILWVHAAWRPEFYCKVCVVLDGLPSLILRLLLVVFDGEVVSVGIESLS